MNRLQEKIRSPDVGGALIDKESLVAIDLATTLEGPQIFAAGFLPAAYILD
jgi:hypothetical protein